MRLSDAQSAIVHSPYDIAIQILASAGTGKTRVLTERVRYILNSTKRKGVIALTFTNKAAEAMQARLTDCDDVEDRAWIATIHSVAQRILEQYGHTIGLPNELHIYDKDKDRMEVFMQSLRDDGVDIDEYLNISDTKEQKNRERNLQSYMDGFSLIKRELLTKEDVEQRFPDNQALWKVFRDYQQALINSGGIDYDDILVYAHKILLMHDWIANIYRSKYKYLCVDEAQDLNKAQYEFIKALCGDSIKSVLMVGDPNQMIYGFNGSSTDYLCKKFVSDFSPVEFSLKENFRSTKAIIRTANKLKPNSQKEHEFALEGDIKIEALDDETSEANWIINKIQHLIEKKVHEEIEGDIAPDKIVVIARNRFVFPKLESALDSNGIAYSIRKGERRTEQASLFGRILDYAICVKLNPKDWVDGKKLCSLLSLIPPANWGGEDLLSDWVKQLKSSSLNNAILYSELMESIDDLELANPNIRKFARDFEEKLKSLADSLPKEWVDSGITSNAEELKRSLDELNEFKSCWTKFKRKGLGDSLAAFRNALALGKLTDKAEGAGITLSTVHTMKGLEKDIVFLMGMCEGVFPDYRAKSKKDIEEERNNAFVAVTRAKRWLYITYSKQRVMPWGDTRFQRQSRFVTEINR
jgi:DNA helicase II / ATP-dependent DNA helicase PcrA